MLQTGESCAELCKNTKNIPAKFQELQSKFSAAVLKTQMFKYTQ